jgi:ABC-type lipoprotein export system ATPase subunit
MKLLRIKIEGLFGQFDYDIKLNQEEGITILTGPNGYGKTTILNIIWSLFNQNFDYIQSVPFKEISLDLDNDQTLCVTIKNEIRIRVTQNEIDVKATQNELVAKVTSDDGIQVPFTGVKPVVFKKLYFKLIDKNAVCETFEFPNVKLGKEHPPVLKPLENIKVYFIKDQRLTQEIVPKLDGTFKFDGTIKANGATVLVKTISVYSKQLVVSIHERKNEEQQLADKLASSQHNRIKALSESLNEGEFRKRFNTLREKYRQLQNIGVYTVDLEDTDYKDNKGYLSIFLQDWEERIAVYDNLVLKINLFLSILNRKPLTNKTISIQTNAGFCFTSSNGEFLQPTDLSSGEQHETILVYELLFNATPNSLVLIDEPETSMHVAWQIEFLQDIESIAKISELSFVVATHSPDLINDKMDLCVDLFENARGNGNHGE